MRGRSVLRSAIAAAGCVALGAMPPLASATAQGKTDSSFLLRAAFGDLPSYFPSYLGNGFIATLTAPRGTEPTQTTMVALMDYTPGDVSRPAQVPGWNGVDFNPSVAGVRQEWLDRGPMSAKRFKDYEQTLDLHDATLTTRYRYLAGGKKTTVEVVSFVSEASPHLAVTRLTLTPHYDGVVRLSFPLTPWAPHTPRFPFARLTGAEQDAALAAHGLSLTPRSPATADRAALWYPGTVAVRSSGGDAHSLSLWLSGKAAHGLDLAMAAAVSLPQGVRAEKVTLDRKRGRIALEVTLRIERGRSYAFTKFVAMSRAGWGGDARADLTLARQARTRGFADLLDQQRSAWHALWQSDIEIEGDPRAQQVAHSELYYLLAGSTPDTGWAVGPCAITLCYVAHVFWDSDTWIFPALLLLHPRHAESLVDFRARTLAAAEARAKQHGFAGAMYPWESDPQNGSDVTPHSAVVLSDSEIHVNSEVAIAQWQYYLATGDLDWLKQHGWPVIRGIATFWASRVTFDKAMDRYEILHVTSPDEAYDDVDNDSFTNAAARKALEIADKAAVLVGAKADPKWAEIASKIYIPFDAQAERHYDFDPSAPHDKITWMGSSLAWLMYPNLDLSMSPTVRRNDFDFQLQALKTHGNSPNEMMIVMLTVGAAELDDPQAVDKWIDRNLVGFLKAPFNVRTETTTNNTGYLLSTSGGFVQGFLYGLSGLRIDNDGLDAKYAPVLPPGWKSVTLKDITWRGKHYDINIQRGADGKAQLVRKQL